MFLIVSSRTALIRSCASSPWRLALLWQPENTCAGAACLRYVGYDLSEDQASVLIWGARGDLRILSTNLSLLPLPRARATGHASPEDQAHDA